MTFFVVVMSIIGYYWDEEIVRQVVDLLQKYQDIFSNNFFEMKGWQVS